MIILYLFYLTPSLHFGFSGIHIQTYHWLQNGIISLHHYMLADRNETISKIADFTNAVCHLSTSQHMISSTHLCCFVGFLFILMLFSRLLWYHESYIFDVFYIITTCHNYRLWMIPGAYGSNTVSRSKSFLRDYVLYMNIRGTDLTAVD